MPPPENLSEDPRPGREPGQEGLSKKTLALSHGASQKLQLAQSSRGWGEEGQLGEGR